MKKFIVIVLMGIIFISGCKKYEDGPLFSLSSKEKRLIGEWSMTINSVDFHWILRENREFDEKAYDSDKNLLISKIGDWSFNKNKENLLITSTSDRTLGLYYLDENGNVVESTESGTLIINEEPSEYKINRLTKDELWIEDENDLILKFEKD